MLCGFMSRWITPLAWAWARPDETSAPSLASSSLARGPFSSIRPFRSPPGTYSMTMYETSRPSNSPSPASYTCTMFGCASRAAVRPSRLKRAPISVLPCPGLSILTATGRSRTSSRPRKTRAMPPAPISRSRTNLPPRRRSKISPASLSLVLEDLPAHRARERLQGLAQPEESLRRERLLRVAQGLLGLVVRLDDQTVRLRRHARLTERYDQVTPPGRVARVYDHRQVREPLGDYHRREVQREARAGLECAYTSLAQDHVLAALFRDVLRREEPLLDRRREATLQDHAMIRPGDGGPDALEQG